MWVYKKLQGAPKTNKRRKKPIRKTKKKWRLFLLFFGVSKFFVASPPAKKFWLRPWFYSHLLNRIMLRIVEAIIRLELCEQSYAERAAQCQEKIHASEAARSAAERARYQGANYTPP